ncbi:MAG TPA: hypothetical protein PLR60_06535 [Syntrophorhabdaceae bacterium]|nr:hypothetical protein [Syntrophorhabdaceae bacterium]
MNKKEFTYVIDGETYTQRPLVLGQIGQIMGLVNGIEITESTTTGDIVALLDDRLPEAVAVILTPRGVKIKDKDLPAIADRFREHMDLQTAMEVVDNFLSLNPIASVLERLTGTMAAIMGVMTGSRGPSLSSRGETSPEGTGSSGDTPRGNASPTSGKGRAGSSSGKR